jgi:beta-phosphoglucomutase
LKKLGLQNAFDVVITGNDVSASKPDPQGYFLAAEKISISPCDCVVVEDSFAGIEGAVNAGMKSIGIGCKLNLHNADYVLPNTTCLLLDKLKMVF